MHFHIVYRSPSGGWIPSGCGSETGGAGGSANDALVVAGVDIIDKCLVIDVQGWIEPSN